MADDDIRVRIAGDLADINKSLADLRRQTNGLGTDARGAARDWSGFGRQLDSLKRQIIGVVGAYAGFRGVQSLIRGVIQATAEQARVMAQVEARIKSTGGAAGLTAEELARMAGELQRATTFSDEDILNAQSQLLTFTKVAKDNFAQATEAALNLSTAMQQDLRTSIVQIGRALNDPVAGLTALSRAGIQFSASQRETIRSMVETGRVADAQRVILAELETQFGGAARAARNTLGGSFEALRNAAGDLLEADDGLPGVTDAVNNLTDTLSAPATKAAFQNLISLVAGLATGLARLTTETVGLMQFVGEEIASRFAGPALDDMVRIEQQIERVRVRLVNLGNEWASTDSAGFRAAQARLQAELRRLEELRRLALEMREPGPSQAAASEASPQAVDVRINLRTLQADLQAAGTLLQDEVRRMRAVLDEELQQGLVTYSEYFQRRAALETQQADQALAQRRNALALLTEEIRLLEERGESTEQQESRRKQLVAEITVLERQRGDVATAAARDQAKAEADLVSQLAQVETRLRQLQGDSIGARAAQLQAEFTGLIQRLAIEGDASGIALVQKLFNVELARTELDKIEEEYQRTVAELTRQEQSLQNQVQTGALTEGEARRRTIQLYQQQVVRVRELIPVMRELAEATGDPAAIERLREMEAELERLETTAKDVGNSIKAAFKDSLEDFAARSIRDVRNIKDAFKDLVDDILNQLARIAARGLISQLGGSFFGAGVAHAGGIAGQSSSIRRISPVEFIGAPRLHSGGIAGLGPGEVPAILKRGEEVLTEDDPRHRNNAGRGINFTQVVDARGSPDPAGIYAAAEALKQQTKTEMFHEMRRWIRRR